MLYKYYLNSHLAMPWMVPKDGLVEVNYHDAGGRYGAVIYDRELTTAEMVEYELIAEDKRFHKWIYVSSEVVDGIELAFSLDFKPKDSPDRPMRLLIAKRCRAAIMYNERIVWENDKYEHIVTQSDLVEAIRKAPDLIDQFFEDLDNYVPRTGSVTIKRMKQGV